MMGVTVSLRSLVAEATGQNPFRCYQCGNCSAGCPTAGRGDLLPHQIFRLLQLDQDEPLRSLQPWLCVGCQTCATRCPQELDLSRVMDALRAEAIRRGTVPPEARRLQAFNQIFVDQVLARGRLNEVELGAVYNLKARVPFQNLASILPFLKRGKLRFDGRRVRGVGKVRRAEKERRIGGAHGAGNGPGGGNARGEGKSS